MKIIDKWEVEKKKCLLAWFGYRCILVFFFLIFNVSCFYGLHIYLLTETVKDGNNWQDLCNFLLNHIYLAGALWLWSLFTIYKRWANFKLFTLLVLFTLNFFCMNVSEWMAILNWCSCICTYTHTCMRHSLKWPQLKLSMSLNLYQLSSVFYSMAQVEMRLCRRMFI